MIPWRINIIIALAALILVTDRVAQGDVSPDFTLEDIDGDLFTLSDHFGTGPILINFWATWCTPCKHELPHLQELFEKYRDKGFILITISEDSPKTQTKVRPYVRSKGFTFKVLLDPDSAVLRLFQGTSLPYQVLIGSDRDILETCQGYSPGDEVVLKRKIRDLLNSNNTDD